MMSSFRGFAKTWFAKVLFVLIMVSFLALGARTGVNSIIASNDVVQAGDRHVTGPEFKHMFDNYMQQLAQQNGGPVPVSDAIANGVDKRLMQEVASDEAELAYLQRVGLRPSDQLVVEVLRDQRDFFDPVSGKFDEKAYKERLAHAELTPAKYESLLRDQIAQSHLAAGLAAGLRTPAIYDALIAAYYMENRHVSYFLIDPRYIPPVPAPSDADLSAFLTKKQIKLPELRTLTVVRFSAKDLASTMPVDEAAVQKLFNFRKDAASAPEKRTLVELPTKDAAAAGAAAKRLKAGETPEAVAKSLGIQPITYFEQPKAGIADPKVADAAFALKAGEVSGPIRGAIAGVPVVLVQSVEPAKVADLNAMRPALEEQARKDAAGQKVYDQVQKFQDVHGGGASIADAAKAAGVNTLTIGPIMSTGVDPYNQPAPGLTPKMLREAFRLNRGGETDVEDDGTGEYFLVRVDAVTPPAPPSLNDPKMRQAVMASYMHETINERLAAKADELAQQLRKGGKLDAVAGSVSAGVQSADMTLMGMQKQQAFPGQLLSQIFSAKVGDVIAGQKADGVYAIARLDAIQPVAPAVGAPLAANATQAQARQIFQGMEQSLRNAAFAAIKPRVYPDRALAALNINPADLPKSGAARKGAGLAQ